MSDVVVQVTPQTPPTPVTPYNILLSTMWGISDLGNTFSILPDQVQGNVPYADGVNINGWYNAQLRYQNNIDSSISAFNVYVSGVTRDALDPNGQKINPTKKNENGLVKLQLAQLSTDPTFPQSATCLYVVSEVGDNQLYGKAESIVTFARHEASSASYLYGTGSSKVTWQSAWPGAQGNIMRVEVLYPAVSGGNISIVSVPNVSVTLSFTPALEDPSCNNSLLLLEANPTASRLFNLVIPDASDGTGPIGALALTQLSGGYNSDGKLVACQTGAMNHGADAGYGNDIEDEDDYPPSGPYKNFNITCNATRAGTTPMFAAIGVKGGNPAAMYTTDPSKPFYNAFYCSASGVSAYFLHYGNNFAITAPGFPPYYSLPPELGGTYSPPTQNPYACMILGTDGLNNLGVVNAILTTMRHFQFPVAVDQTDESIAATTAGVANTINVQHYLGQTPTAQRLEYLTEKVIVDEPLVGSEATHREWTYRTAGGLSTTYKMGSGGFLVGTVNGFNPAGKLTGSVAASVKAAIAASVTVADLKTALAGLFA